MKLEILRFALVGTIGFLVDAGILLALIQIVGFNKVSARLCSFLVAVTVTWILNRRITFRSKATNKWHEWCRYVSANAIGGLINLGVYFMLVLSHHSVLRDPLIAVAISSIVAMAFNFSVSKWWVFRRSRRSANRVR